jgi:hypothetical protein
MNGPRLTSMSKRRSPYCMTSSVLCECSCAKLRPEKTAVRSGLFPNWANCCADKGSFFGHLTYHLATALFFTGCRYHEWALLTMDRLVREPGGVIIAARLQVKGGSFRDLPLTRELSDSLGGWFAFLERRRAAAAGWGSQLRGIGARLSWQERRAL